MEGCPQISTIDSHYMPWWWLFFSQHHSPLAISFHASILGSKIPSNIWALQGLPLLTLGDFPLLLPCYFGRGKSVAQQPFWEPGKVGHLPHLPNRYIERVKRCLAMFNYFSLFFEALILHSGKTLHLHWRMKEKKSYIRDNNIKLGAKIWAYDNRGGEDTSGEKKSAQILLYHNIRNAYILYWNEHLKLNFKLFWRIPESLRMSLQNPRGTCTLIKKLT